MQFAIAIAAAIAIVIVSFVVVYLAWRGYKTKKEWFPLILAICAFPVLIVLAVFIVHGNL